MTTAQLLLSIHIINTISVASVKPLGLVAVVIVTLTQHSWSHTNTTIDVIICHSNNKHHQRRFTADALAHNRTSAELGVKSTHTKHTQLFSFIKIIAAEQRSTCLTTTEITPKPNYPHTNMQSLFLKLYVAAIYSTEV